MKLAPALAALAACGLWGCDSGRPPPPRVVSIEPNTMSSSSSVQATITIEAVLTVDVDYGAGAMTLDPSIVMSVGSVPVGSGTYTAGGHLPVRIPSKLQPGPQDVTVTLDGDRVGVLQDGFTVTAGQWPAGGFAIAPIATPQHVDVPFTLTITAQGTFANQFNGTVDYVIQNVSIQPVTTGPFTNGVYQESIVLHAPVMGTTHITVVDLLGDIATSNDFAVTP
jgi:hypothetical protein